MGWLQKLFSSNETASDTAPAADGSKKITVKANGGGVKIDVRVTEVTDDTQKIDPKDTNYKIRREEWDRTFGPMLNRATGHFLGNSTKRLEGYDVDMAYENMKKYNGHDAFHTLMGTFSSASRPEPFDASNNYEAKLKKFSDVLKNEDAVLVTEKQLQALANMVKGGADFALKKPGRWEIHTPPESAKEFYKMHYSGYTP